MADTVINTLSLCSGVGMLDVGFHAGLEHLGIASRVIAYAEWDAYAAAQLVALMEAGCLDAAPVWCGDLGRLDGASFRGRVDAVVGGFPCQDHSVAGKREGVEGKRWIWPAIVGIIRDSGAWLVVLENVRGLLSSGGMAPVLADLADLGFHVEWTVLGAGEVGASHRRERVFIVAIRRDCLDNAVLGRYRDSNGEVQPRWNGAVDADGYVAHGASGRFRELREPSGRDGQPDGGNEQLDDSGRSGSERQIAQREGALAVTESDADALRSEQDMARPARHGGDGSHQESGSGRGVCGDGGEVADALCAGRQQDARGAHGDEGADEGRSSQHDHVATGARANGLADAGRAESGRRADSLYVDRSGPSGCAGGRSGELADTSGAGSQGRTESGLSSARGGV